MRVLMKTQIGFMIAQMIFDGNSTKDKMQYEMKDDVDSVNMDETDYISEP